MSVPSPTPPITVPSTPDPTTRDQLTMAAQGLVVLLGLVGVNVPPIWTSAAVVQQVISIILIVGPLIMAGYHRLVTAPAQAHASAVASAAVGRPLRAV